MSYLSSLVDRNLEETKCRGFECFMLLCLSKHLCGMSYDVCTLPVMTSLHVPVSWHVDFGYWCQGWRTFVLENGDTREWGREEGRWKREREGGERGKRNGRGGRGGREERGGKGERWEEGGEDY